MYDEKKYIIWIDDDPNLLRAERFDLTDLGYSTIEFRHPSRALDWLAENEHKRNGASALIIDALMPSFDDKRFLAIDDTPAGLLLCRELSKFPDWAAMRPRCVLYTRLPGGLRLERVRAKAAELEVCFCKKSRSSRIAVELLDAKLIK